MYHPDAFNPVPGRAEEVAPGVRRILCDNPSAFTFRGTNTYLVANGGGVAVIDPGPLDVMHQQAILDALQDGETITHIFVTHAHSDHSPLARPLAKMTGAPVLAYGDATAGQSEVMRALAAQGGLGGGEGSDTGFAPDIVLEDEQIVEGDGWRLQALWTPGHHSNHMCFDLALGDGGFGATFVGDLVMDWSTSIVSPPDGDLTQFMDSCRRMRARAADLYLSGHGDLLRAPHERLEWLITHREQREAGILTALEAGPGNATDLAARVYTDIDRRLLPAAARNVLAHLIDLHSKNMVSHNGELTADTVFARV